MKYVVKAVDESGRRLLERYVERRRAETRLIAQLVAEGDFEEARRLGHNWFGSGAAYDLPRISMLGERLEQAAERRDAAAAAEIARSAADFLEDVVVSPPA